jgi:hypothetical protein
MRRIVASLVIAASLVAPVAITALWLRGEVLNTHRYVQTVTPLASNDAVLSAVADEITTALLAQVSVSDVAKDVLPGALGGLAPTLDRSVHAYTQKLIERSLRTGQFRELWVVANTQAHKALLAELDRKPSRLISPDGSIDLDLSNALGVARQALASAGIQAFDQVQPALLRPKFQIARGSSINGLRDATRALKALSVALPVAAIVLFGLAFALSRDRRRTLRLAGISLALAGAAGLVGVVIGRTYYLHDVVGPDVPAAVATAFYDTVLSGLRFWLKVQCLVGLGAFAVALLAGPSRAAVRIRSLTLRTAGGAADRAAGKSVTVGWVAENKSTLRTLVVISGLLVLVAARHPSGRFLLELALGMLICLAAIELLARPRGVR